MNNEEIERKMNFIVEQQAQFASDIQQLQESQARTDHVVAQTAEVVSQMGEVVTRLANVTHAGFGEVNAKINALVDSQIRTEENLTRTDKNVARTDENLKSLIATVDRYFSEGRNGK
jgi:ABC-type transporter Mla subunit MlaD